MTQTHKNRKIALVYDATYPYVKGGGEKRFHEMGLELVQQGYEVHLYGMKFWDGPKVIKKDGLYLHGIGKARPLYKKNGQRSIAQALLFGFSCLKLLGEDFDTIDCCGFPYFSLFSCKIVTILKRKPLYATWHEVWGKSYWQQYLGWFGLAGYWVEFWATKLPSTFIAVSDHTAEQLRTTFNPKQPIHVVENGIRSAEIQATAASKQSSDVIYVGRLVAFKHIDILIRAIVVLVKTLPNIRLIIIGDGPQKTSLENLTTKLQLQKNVTFMGFIDTHASIIATMKASQVFVLPSSREGFSIVAVEANASGLPVVTVNEKNNAAQKLITAKNGLVVALSAKPLAAAIAELLSKKTDVQACVTAAEKYDWLTLSQKLAEVLV